MTGSCGGRPKTTAPFCTRLPAYVPGDIPEHSTRPTLSGPQTPQMWAGYTVDEISGNTRKYPETAHCRPFPDRISGPRKVVFRVAAPRKRPGNARAFPAGSCHFRKVAALPGVWSSIPEMHTHFRPGLAISERWGFGARSRTRGPAADTACGARTTGPGAPTCKSQRASPTDYSCSTHSLQGKLVTRACLGVPHATALRNTIIGTTSTNLH